MTKVVAPAMSLDASGTLAGTLVFSKWKGRNYVRQHVIPANPKSAGQTGIRSMFQMLAQNWQNLSTPNQATWEDRADDNIISPFNAFMSYNMDRWRNFVGPSKEDPSTDDGTTGAATIWTATGGVRQVTLQFRSDAPNDNWGIMIFRSLSTGFATSWANCIKIIRVEDATPITHVDTPLAPATYYYNLRLFTDVGNYSAEIAERTAAAT